jgi:YebC/PmpR family DNA-binding regulatory protein
MAGHNKWSKIKRQKEKTDAQKSKIFSKLAKAISTAVKEARGDKNSPSVRAVVDKAREFNMPLENIERAIKKSSEAGAMESVTYEAYGPGGCALIIEALTTNRNKAAQEVKHILSESGFELAAPGSASWAFTKEHGEWKPNMTVPISEEDGKMLEDLIEKLEENDEVQDVYTNAE